MDSFSHFFATLTSKWYGIQVISHDMKGNMICVGIEFCGLHLYVLIDYILICLLLHYVLPHLHNDAECLVFF